MIRLYSHHVVLLSSKMDEFIEHENMSLTNEHRERSDTPVQLYIWI